MISDARRVSYDHIIRSHKGPSNLISKLGLKIVQELNLCPTLNCLVLYNTISSVQFKLRFPSYIIAINLIFIKLGLTC